MKGSSTSAVLSAYFGAYALVLLPGGELVDRFGARNLALGGLALFAVGALAGALVSTFGQLIAARVVQGAGAGLVSPAALAGRGQRLSARAARQRAGDLGCERRNVEPARPAARRSADGRVRLARVLVGAGAARRPGGARRSRG